MNFYLLEIGLILTIHWIADFVCQSDKMAMKKSTSNVALLQHDLIYCMIWGLALLPWLFLTFEWAKPIPSVYSMLIFYVVTFVSHFAIDYITSRATSKLWNQGQRHGFFVMIGFDQLIHAMQLFVTYYYCFKVL